MQQRKSSAALYRPLSMVMALWLVAILASEPLGAQRTCDRCLNGFRFLPSSIVGDPFATTHFLNETGGGVAVDLTVPVRDINGVVVDTISGDIGFLLLDFEYQIAVARWLALRATASAVGRVGTSTEALVASGASAAFGGSLGATVPIWRNRMFLVSAVANFRRNTQYLIDPYAFAQEVADSGYTDETKQVLLRTQDANQWSAGIRAAWAIRSWVGLNAQVESGEIDDPTSGNESLTELGVQAGFDFAELWRVPIGASLGYREQTGPARTGDFSGSYRIYELGLFYTGRPDYSIGGDFFWSRVVVNGLDAPAIDALQFRLVTRIDF